jgi:type VI protein secretion system component Hcp
MEEPLHRAKALAVAMLLLIVATATWFARDGSDASAAAAATPYGEVTIKDFSGSQKLTSDIRNHSWEVTAPVSGGLPAGDAEFGFLFVRRSTSPASPKIARAVARGFQYPKVTVKIFKPGTLQTKTTYIIEGVHIISLRRSGQTENIGFVYNDFELIYGDNTFCWDVPSRAECAT